MQLVTHDQVKSKIIKIREQNILLDSDVAELYSVETKVINQAVKRNQEKFPDGYVFQLTSQEMEYMRSQIVTASKRNLTNPPKAFTQRGLYMLATILKSKQAIIVLNFYHIFFKHKKERKNKTWSFIFGK